MPSTSEIKSNKRKFYPNGKLIIAAAGSGKTTHIIKDALEACEKLGQYERVLITTYTNNNEEEIKKKIREKHGFIPSNIVVQTWFSFLLQHGVRPYQDTLFEELWDKRIKGVLPVNGQSGSGNSKLDDYFTQNLRIYTDKLSCFAYKTIKKERKNNKNFTLSRIKAIFPKIYIDEMQDLAGYDLNFVELLIKEGIEITLVGDPRQCTYLTNRGTKGKRKDGSRKNATEFFEGKIDIDEKTLNGSYRNCQAICDFANRIHDKVCTSKAEECGDFKREEFGKHNGVWIVRKVDFEKYYERYAPKILRDSKKVILPSFVKTNDVLNFGASKGLTFDRVLIYSTKAMQTWLKNSSVPFRETSKNKTDQAAGEFYAAVTRARYSVTFVLDETTFNELRSPKSQNSMNWQPGGLFAPEQKHEPALPYKFFDPSENRNCA